MFHPNEKFKNFYNTKVKPKKLCLSKTAEINYKHSNSLNSKIYLNTSKSNNDFNSNIFLDKKRNRTMDTSNGGVLNSNENKSAENTMKSSNLNNIFNKLNKDSGTTSVNSLSGIKKSTSTNSNNLLAKEGINLKEEKISNEHISKANKLRENLMKQNENIKPTITELAKTKSSNFVNNSNHINNINHNHSGNHSANQNTNTNNLNISNKAVLNAKSGIEERKNYTLKDNLNSNINELQDWSNSSIEYSYKNNKYDIVDKYQSRSSFIPEKDKEIKKDREPKDNKSVASSSSKTETLSCRAKKTVPEKTTSFNQNIVFSPFNTGQLISYDKTSFNDDPIYSLPSSDTDSKKSNSEDHESVNKDVGWGYNETHNIYKEKTNGNDYTKEVFNDYKRDFKNNIPSDFKNDYNDDIDSINNTYNNYNNNNNFQSVSSNTMNIVKKNNPDVINLLDNSADDAIELSTKEKNVSEENMFKQCFNCGMVYPEHMSLNDKNYHINECFDAN